MDILTQTRRPLPTQGPIVATIGAFFRGGAVGQPASPAMSTTPDALLSTSGASRLFETDSDVRNYANRVNAQVVSLEADIMNAARKKYGPEVFSASVTLAQLPQFQKDKAFYQSWSAFRKSWEAFKSDLDDSSFIILSANKYREVEKYDTDVRAWRERFKAQGIVPTAPPTTQPGTIPGVTPPTNPAAPPPPKDPNAFNWNGLLWVGGALVALMVLREIRPEREVVVAKIGSPPKPRGPSLSERYQGARSGWRNPRKNADGSDIQDAEFEEDTPPSRFSTPRRLTAGR